MKKEIKQQLAQGVIEHMNVKGIEFADQKRVLTCAYKKLKAATPPKTKEEVAPDV